MTDRPDPIARPATGDPAIEDATAQIVETWRDATPGKEPSVTPDDFRRMREGVTDLDAQTHGDAQDG